MKLDSIASKSPSTIAYLKKLLQMSDQLLQSVIEIALHQKILPDQVEGDRSSSHAIDRLSRGGLRSAVWGWGRSSFPTDCPLVDFGVGRSRVQ